MIPRATALEYAAYLERVKGQPVNMPLVKAQEILEQAAETERECSRIALIDESPDWREMCEQYPLGDALNEGPNKSVTSSEDDGDVMLGVWCGLLISAVLFAVGLLIWWAGTGAWWLKGGVR